MLNGVGELQMRFNALCDIVVDTNNADGAEDGHWGIRQRAARALKYE